MSKLETGSLGAYRTIVIDPPWEVGRGPKWKVGGANQPLDYPTMGLEEIAALPIGEFAASSAHLYIWTINSYIEETYAVARAWGFKPSTMLTWCKAPHGLGLGGTYVHTTEHVLFCRRGVCPSKERVDSTWWRWVRGPHSAKPDAFLDMVQAISPGPRLEVFARKARLGWDYAGDESLGTVEIPGLRSPHSAVAATS